VSGVGTTRRRFVAAGGSLVGVGVSPRSLSAAAPVRKPLSRPLSDLKPIYDVVVIGSGYGGSVMAARLAQGRRMCVLERGREWLPSDFPSRLDSVLSSFRSASRPLGLFDYRVGDTLDVMVGNGLGGTSLINANTIIAPDREVFEHWPLAIQRDVARGRMDAWEARVRQTLAGDSVGEFDAVRKQAYHRTSTQARQRAGVPVVWGAATLAVNLRQVTGKPNANGVTQSLCTHCGDCVTGCRVGAKNTLDVNYLPQAHTAGAELFSRVEVEWLERLADGRWRVHLLLRPDDTAAVRSSIVAASVVLAAGVLGSAQILLRSRAQGLALSPTLGNGVSANGDLLGFGYNTSVQTNVLGYGEGLPLTDVLKVGPTITATARHGHPRPVSERFLLQEAAIPSALVDAVRLAMPLAAGSFADFPAAQRRRQDMLGRRADGALNHSMLYLCTGHDSGRGRIELDTTGVVKLVWPGVAQEPFVVRARSEMEQHAQLFGGRYVDYPRSSPVFGGALTTVHPLGGCAMADSADGGVVNADAQVFDPRGGPKAVYDNLRVVDGSVVPRSIGVNPLLCIAAIAERSAERFRI
jgi:cholesterol oxidase